MALKSRRRWAAFLRHAKFRARAAGWTGARRCRTGGLGCIHLDCDRCGASDMVPPGSDVYPRHDCPKERSK
jgi:hypothetical protein